MKPAAAAVVLAAGFASGAAAQAPLPTLAELERLGRTIAQDRRVASVSPVLAAASSSASFLFRSWADSWSNPGS